MPSRIFLTTTLLFSSMLPVAAVGSKHVPAPMETTGPALHRDAADSQLHPSVTGRETPRPAQHFGWPVTPHRVVRLFAPPAVRWGAGHRGVDLASHAGADVVAPSDGIVTFSGVIAGRGVVSVRHPQGFSTTYEPVGDRVGKGTVVHRGQRLGRLEAGHCSDAACLHWGYRIDKDTYRNPLALVGMRRPILLPPLGDT